MTDIPNSTASTARITVGGTYSGTYETPSDRDAIGFEATGGVTYRVTLDRGELDNTTLGDVQSLVSGFDLQERHISPRTDGTVFVPVRGYDGRGITGPYTLTLSEVAGDLSPWPGNTPVLSLGDSLQSALDFNDDRDLIGLMLEAGQGYRISVLSDGNALSDRNLSPSTILQGTDGSRLRDAENLFDPERGDKFITYTPTETGQVFLVVSELFSIPVGYEVRVDTFNDLPPGLTTPATLSVGGSVEGTFEYRVDQDAYAIELEAGPTYAFSLTGAGKQISLRNAAGGSVNFTFGGSPVLETQVAESGTFYVAVKTGEFFNGDYTLSAAIINEIPATPETEARLDVGVPLNDSLYRGDSDWFGITLDPDTTYRASYADLDSYNVSLSLHDAAGETVLEEPMRPRYDFDAGPRSLVFSSAAVSDAAFLGISGQRGSYDYTLLLEEVADVGQTDAGAATLAIAEDLRGHLFQRDVDRFAVDLPDDLVGPTPDSALEAYLVTVTGVGFGTRPELRVDTTFAQPGPDAAIKGVYGQSAYEVVFVEPEPGAELFVDVFEVTGPRFGQPGSPFYDLRVDPVSLGTDSAERLLASDDSATLALGGDDTVVGSAGNDLVWAGTGDDLVFAVQGDNTVRGEGGNDTLHLGAGNDEAEGGSGNDLLIGYAGADSLSGNAGGDRLFGGDGDDILNGGQGPDRLNGGAGADQFFHLGRASHGTDWVQDYDTAEGDVLVYGGSARRAGTDDFRVEIRDVVGAGADGISEAFIVHRETRDVLWVLVDGAEQSAINMQIGGEMFDLLA